MTYFLVDGYKAKKLNRMIHKHVLEIITDHKGFVAGGTVTSLFSGQRINDIDVFFLAKEDVLAACVDAIRELEVDKEPLNTEACLSFYYKGLRYQFIKMLCGYPSDVISRFDFTVCQGSWMPGEDGFMLCETFLQDLASRTLIFNLIAKYPIASMFRVRKFLSRGFHISGIELIKMSLCIHKLNLETFADLKEQLLGVDTLLLKEFLDQIANIGEVEYEFSHFIEQLDAYLATECQMFSEEDANEHP